MSNDDYWITKQIEYLEEVGRHKVAATLREKFEAVTTVDEFLNVLDEVETVTQAKAH